MFAVFRRVMLVLVVVLGLVAGVEVSAASATTQSLTVTVVDPRTGQPVSAYRTCVFAEPDSGATPIRGCTNSAGTIVFQLDDTLQYRLVARTVPSNSDYLFGYYYGGTQDPATATLVRPPNTVTFPLALGARAVGTLTFPNGQPASNYHVTVRSPETTLYTATATTGLDGTWSTSSVLPPGRYIVEFSGLVGTSWAYGKTSPDTATILDFVGGINTVNDQLVPPAGGFPVPVLTVPTSPVLVQATSSTGASVDYSGLVSAATAGGGAATIFCDLPANAFFFYGDTVVTCTATDPSTGVSTSGQFAIRVADTQAPDLTVPAPVTAVASGPDGAVVSVAAPTAYDTIDGAVTPTCDHAYTAFFPLGTTTVSCRASDSRGNTSYGSFTVTVVPSQADLQVTVTAPATLDKRSTGVWRVTVLNQGPAPATALRVAMSVQGLTLVSTSPTTKVGKVQVGVTTITGPAWSIPSLGAGASQTFEVTAGPTASRADTWSVTAGAVSAMTDPVMTNNLATGTTTVVK